MISLVVNGKERRLKAPMTVQAYLEQLGVGDRMVAVEHNGRILKREEHTQIVLQQGDKLEIIHMVGGG